MREPDADFSLNDIDLAMLLERQVRGRPADTVVQAICWVLAAIVVQGDQDGYLSEADGVAAIARQLSMCIHRLRQTSSRVH